MKLPRSHRPPLNRHPQGIALVAVLWLIALLTVLATAAVTLTAGQRRAAERIGAIAQATSAADGAIRLTLLELIAPTEHHSAPRARQERSLAVLGTDVQVHFDREIGRIDLNTAEEELLFAAFAANGWDEAAARALSARILDWRDPDDLPRTEGAERTQYAFTGLRYGPRNSPFESIQELRQVLGGEAIDELLLDAFTVYTSVQVPAEEAAPESVLRALRFADERTLAGRRWVTAREEAALPVAALPGERQRLIGEVLRVRACATVGRTRICRRAIVRLTGHGERPIQVYAWESHR